MKIYRLSKLIHAEDLSGRGAEIAGGRWNSKGTAMHYTASSVALATTELAVHLPLGILPKGYVVIAYNIPDDLMIEELNENQLPADFKSIPPSDSTQRLGDDFIISKRKLILKVPSVVIKGDFNYLINPSHQDIARISVITIEKYEFDKRLFIR